MENKDPSRSEQATAKKIQETRRDGNVMKSQDIVSVAVLFIGFILTILLTAPELADAFGDIFKSISLVDCRKNWTEEFFISGGIASILLMGKIILPVGCAAGLTAILALKMQIGPYFSTKTLEWKLDKLKPNFSSITPKPQMFVQLGLTMSKMSVIAIFIYLTITSNVRAFIELPMRNFRGALQWILELILFLIIKIICILIILAIIDYIYKRVKYFVDIRMTKQEVKDERKNADGDPRVKSEIRKRMYKLFFSIMAQVPKADVVITNPTHVAVALKYEPGSPAPTVVAKGLRKRAQRIKEVARNAGVPIIEAPPLARGLYRGSKLGEFIPSQFFSAVAAILARLHKAGIRSFNIT